MNNDINYIWGCFNAQINHMPKLVNCKKYYIKIMRTPGYNAQGCNSLSPSSCRKDSIALSINEWK